MAFTFCLASQIILKAELDRCESFRVFAHPTQRHFVDAIGLRRNSAQKDANTKDVSLPSSPLLNRTILFFREDEETSQADVDHKVAGSFKEEEEEMGIFGTLVKLEELAEALLSR